MRSLDVGPLRGPSLEMTWRWTAPCPRVHLTSGMAPSDIDALRTQLGDRYRIERELGRGGMGAVYLARELGLDRLVALKVLPPAFATDQALRERFLRETRMAASFSHPNIVPVHAVEERDQLLAFAMGYVEGESLADRVKRAGPLGSRDTVRMLQDVAYALAYAHGRGVVHRDIKPDNIMIERATGRALVMDFGVSRTIAAPAAGAGLTRVGEVVGTPEYMSPEQAVGDHVDGRSDLYALGLVAWYAVTGRTAVTGENTQQILVKQLTESLPPLAAARPELPAALCDLVDRCLVKEASGRFADAGAMVEALEAAQLVAPEIPLPVRLFANEAGTLGLVSMFVIVFIWIIGAFTFENDTAGVDRLIPLVFLVAVMITRVVQVFIEAQALGTLGFSAGEVLRGMLAVVEERAVQRRERAADGIVQARRRRAITRALWQIAITGLLVAGALTQRQPRPQGGYRTGPLGLTMLFSALGLGGASFVMLLRSPFRMPQGERAFRAVWLGAPGRLFVDRAIRSRGASAGGATHSPEVSVAASTSLPRSRAAVDARERIPESAPVGSAPVAAVPSDALASLDARVTALERWRESRQ